MVGGLSSQGEVSDLEKAIDWGGINRTLMRLGRDGGER